MKIGEVAKQLGINTSAIRFYEKEGLLSTRSPVRTGNGYRDYSAADIEQIAWICQLKHLGLELSDIKLLLNNNDSNCSNLQERLETQITKYTQLKVAIEQRINALTQAKSACAKGCSAQTPIKQCCA